MTIEDLAVITKHGFDAVDKRFDKVEGRLMNLEGDVSYLKSRVEEIGRTLGEHTEILEEHSEELRLIHKKLDEFTDPKNKNRFVTYQEFTELEARVTAFEKKLLSK